jgi:hypothetical protein
VSDKAISVGDLVVVVRGHECGIGNTGVVRTIGLSTGSGKCDICGEIVSSIPNEPLAYIGRWVQTWRLKRIPPYDQLEHFRTEESLRRDVKEKA